MHILNIYNIFIIHMSVLYFICSYFFRKKGPAALVSCLGQPHHHGAEHLQVVFLVLLGNGRGQEAPPPFWMLSGCPSPLSPKGLVVGGLQIKQCRASVFFLLENFEREFKTTNQHQRPWL